MTGRSPASAHQSVARVEVSADQPGSQAATTLAERLRILREQRISDEREGARLPSLLRAIDLTRRDRDSGISAPLRAHRTHLERVWADAENLIVTTVQVAIRAHLRSGDTTNPIIRQAQHAIEHSQLALHQLSEAVTALP